MEIGRLNSRLLAEKVPYVLIGVGRWGSRDPWLGIPVTWDQVAGAKVIVEAGLRDLKVTPSQGSHFFQNLTSFQVGYFTVNADEGFVDWAWLGAHGIAQDGTAMGRPMLACQRSPLRCCSHQSSARRIARVSPAGSR